MNRYEKNGKKYSELDLVIFLRDLFHDSAEQTNAMKQLAEAYSKIINEIYTSKEAQEKNGRIEEFFEQTSNKIDEYKNILLNIEQKNTVISNRLEELCHTTNEIGSKTKVYIDLVKEIVDEEKKRSNTVNDIAIKEMEHKQLMEKMKKESDDKIKQMVMANKIKLTGQIIGYILGGSGIVALLATLLLK